MIIFRRKGRHRKNFYHDKQTTQDCEQHVLEEVSVVEMTHATVYPRAMMIHLENTPKGNQLKCGKTL